MVGVRLRLDGSVVSVIVDDRLVVENVRNGKSLLGLLSATEGVAEDLTLAVSLSRTESNLDGVSDTTLSAAGLAARAGSADPCCDMPGKPLRPANTSSSPLVSSLLFLYAALPIPLSAVCLKYDGSRAPSEAAIWSRDS